MLSTISSSSLPLVIVLLLLSACRTGNDGDFLPASGNNDEPPTAAVPHARDDFAATEMNRPVDIDVLANDCREGTTCQAGEPRPALESFERVTAQGGSVERNDQGTDDSSDDTLIYMPPTDFVGHDHFEYTITNQNGLEDSATVFVTVREPEKLGTCHENIEEKRQQGLRYCIETSFESFDGTVIAMQLFVPDRRDLHEVAEQAGDALAVDDPGFAPLLVHSHGFGGQKTRDFDVAGQGPDLDKQIAQDAWHAGYWVISYTQRGFGGVVSDDPDDWQEGSPEGQMPSGGQIDLMSPVKEGLDFVSLLNWAECYLREDLFDAAGTAETISDSMPLPADLADCPEQYGQSLLMNDNHSRLVQGEGAAEGDDDPSVGTLGYSYGGGFQFVAQSVDERVDALLPMGTWFDLRYSLHSNDTPKTTWIEIMTAFAINGGNSEPLPELIIEGNLQVNGANTDPRDFPYNKARQVSVANMNLLAPNGAVGYCDGNAELFDPFDAEGLLPDPFDLLGDDTPLPPNTTTDRKPRAHLLMIQGHGDTLFNMNEGYDNARCFAQTPELDVRLISQSSGHPLPIPQEAGGPPPHYAGRDSSMYLDEVIHCGSDPIDGEPVRYNLREVGLAWFDDKLRGQGHIDNAFPHQFCITQANTQPELLLAPNDEYFSGTNTGPSAYRFPREGVVGDIKDFPVGGSLSAVNQFSRFTGPATLSDTPLTDDFIVSAPLHTAEESQTLAGIPLAALTLTRTNLLNDEIVYVGLGVRRCHQDPFADPLPPACLPEEERKIEALQHQVTPLRLYPNDDVSGSEASFPMEDPRNELSIGPSHHYPIIWGDNPGGEAPGSNLGRLTGVSTRLHPGDEVLLLLYARHPVYLSLTSPAPGAIQIGQDSEVWLPLQPSSRPPAGRPDYIIHRDDLPEG